MPGFPVHSTGTQKSRKDSALRLSPEPPVHGHRDAQDAHNRLRLEVRRASRRKGRRYKGKPAGLKNPALRLSLRKALGMELLSIVLGRWLRCVRSGSGNVQAGGAEAARGVAPKWDARKLGAPTRFIERARHARAAIGAIGVHRRNWVGHIIRREFRASDFRGETATAERARSAKPARPAATKPGMPG